MSSRGRFGWGNTLSATTSPISRCSAGWRTFNAHPDPDDWKEPIPAEVSQAWNALRKLPEASFLGLALPRFVLRQSYGKESDPIDAFPFEELTAEAAHESN